MRYSLCAESGTKPKKYNPMPRTYIDDNFGEWEIEDDDDIDFYDEIQKSNVEKTCKGCGRIVHIQPHYAYCNSCADTIERGGELPGYDGDGDDEEEVQDPDDVIPDPGVVPS